jgi:hypothetical protein
MVKTSVADLLRLALDLPAGDRLALAPELLNSVEGAEDEDWSAAWVQELDRRTTAVERGEELLDPWETVEPFKISLKDGTRGIGRRVASSACSSTRRCANTKRRESHSSNPMRLSRLLRRCGILPGQSSELGTT